MHCNRVILVIALVALASSAVLAQPKASSTAKGSKSTTSNTRASKQGPDYRCYNSCECCSGYSNTTCPDGTDVTAYDCCVEVVPLCPVLTPPGAPPEVVKQVQTTITVIFPCTDELWDDLTAEQQRPFRNGTYVPAEDIDPELLDAFNLLDLPAPGNTSASARSSIINDVAVNVNVDLSGPDDGNPASCLVAILYLEEFQQWQILAADADCLQTIIVRVTNIEPEEPNAIPGSPNGRRLLQSSKKPKKRRAQSVVRNSHHKTTGRDMPTTEALENSMRQLLQASTNDPLFPEQYHLPLTDTPQAWEITRGSKDIIIAVVDTGCDVSHPDLARNICVNPGEDAGDGVDNDGDGFVDDINGANFINTQPANDLTDVVGHGTHVAGIAAARGNNGIGVSGVMQRAAILCLKTIVGSTEPGPDPAFGPVDATVRAWHYALRRGVRIINNSWASLNPLPDNLLNALFDRTSDAYQGQINRFERPLLRLQQAGVLMVWAAGNTGSDIDPPNLTTAPNTVLSTLRNQDNDEPGKVNLQLNVVNTQENESISPSSSRGDIETDLGAPGTLILSTIPRNRPLEDFITTCTATPAQGCITNDIYGYLTGTSMAAPVVSGVAGLCLAVLEPCHRADDTQIAYDCILATVDPTDPLQGNTRTGGRVNTGAAVACCQQFCDRRPGEAAKGGKNAGNNRPRPAPQATGPQGTGPQSAGPQSAGPQSAGPAISTRNRDAFVNAVNNLADRMNQLAGRG